MRTLWALAATLCLALLSAGQAEARWLKAESPKFVVYSDGDEGVLRDYMRRLEMFDTALRVRLHRQQAPVGRPLPIYLVRDSDALRQVWPGASDNIRGFYSSGGDDIFAVAIRTRGEDETLKHEYVHHFMSQHLPAAFPGWLVEGFAEYFEAGEIGQNRVELGKPNQDRIDWLLNARWIPMDVVLGQRALALKDGQTTAMYYAQAWVLTHYMMSDSARQQQLVAYMRDVGEKGTEPLKAFEAATGMNPEATERALRRYLTSGSLVSQVISGSGFKAPEMTITSLPPAADDLLLLGQAVKHGVPEAERPTLLQKVRAGAAKHAGERLAQIILARAELDYGDRNAGEAVLKRLVEANARDDEALVLLAESRMAAAANESELKAKVALFKEAQGYATRAMLIDQERYQTLRAWVRSRSVERGYPGEQELEAQLKAVDLAPQLPALRLETARNLLRTGRRDYAAAVLAPVVNHPHQREAAAAAKALLAQAQGGETQAAKAAPAK